MTDTSAPAGRSNPFWDFSLKIYSSAAVQQACVTLQDESGVDVNVLLYMLWHAYEGRRLGDAEGRAVLDAVERWRADVVVPLRTARRNLKQPPAGFDTSGAESLRSIVKKAELEAERLQQSALHALALPGAVPGAGVRETAAANASAYADALGRPLASAPLDVMLDAVQALAARAGH